MTPRSLHFFPSLPLSLTEREESINKPYTTHRRAFLWPSIPYEESTTNVEKKDPTNPSISSQIHLCLNPNFHPSFRSYVTFHLSRGKRISDFRFVRPTPRFLFFPLASLGARVPIQLTSRITISSRDNDRARPVDVL